MLRRTIVSTLFLYLFAVAAISAQTAPAPQPEFDVKAHYTKYEFRIPMRDGVRLFTAVYVPKDASPANKYPFLVNRTPYSVGPYGVDNYPRRLGTEELQQAGYIFVAQDVRGRWMSEGTFEEMRPHIDNKKSNKDVDDSSDMYDTVEFLLKNVPNNNGNVGILGISYPGFFTSASIIDSHPAIKAASPQAPMTNLFMTDDAYHGGAFMLAGNFNFYSFFKPQKNPVLPPKDRAERDFGSNDGYDLLLKMGPTANGGATFFKENGNLWRDQVAHTTYDDYWKARNIAPHMKNIKCAVLTVGGWFDAEDLQGPFSTYNAIEKSNSGIYNGLVIGPWVHGGWQRWDGRALGRVSFDSNTGEFYRKNILLPFFEQYLKGKGEAKLPEAYVFETGTNVWRQYASWPPKDAKKATLYFHEDGKLSFDPPAADPNANDEYVSDPNRPVPFVAYTAVDVPQEYMVSDQRFASRRPDVLVYQTEPLDHDITVVGPVSPKLFASTSGTDSDFVVKLIDVYPNDYPEPKVADESPRRDVRLPNDPMGGYQQLVRGEPMRAKFRHSWEKPEAMAPGKVEEIDFTMPDVNHTFRAGHRIMVQVQSTWFPLVDRNPQTFVDIPNAKTSDFQKATQRIYRSKQQPSAVVVQTLEP